MLLEGRLLYDSTQYVPGESRKVFSMSEVKELTKLGFLVVRGPRYENDPFILSMPMKVIVTYVRDGIEKKADLKDEIKKAYNRYYRYHGQKTIVNFTRKRYEQFVTDLNAKNITAFPNKYRTGADIWFRVEKVERIKK